MDFGLDVFRDGVYGLGSAAQVLRLAIIITALGFFVHLSARMVVKKSTIWQAIVAVVVGVLAFYLVVHLVTVWEVALILGLVAFAGAITVVYKTKQLGKGAAIGALAWVMFYLGGLLLQWLADLR